MRDVVIANVIAGLVGVVSVTGLVYREWPHAFHCDWPKWEDSVDAFDALNEVYLYQRRTCTACGKTQFRRTARFPSDG